MGTYGWNQSTGSGSGDAFSTGNVGASVWGKGGQAYSTALGESYATMNQGFQTWGGGESFFVSAKTRTTTGIITESTWDTMSYAGTGKVTVDGKVLPTGTGWQTSSGNASAYTKFDFSSLD